MIVDFTKLAWSPPKARPEPAPKPAVMTPEGTPSFHYRPAP